MDENHKQSMSREEIVRQFVGDWHIERHILDLDSEWLGRFDGMGTFTETDEGLHYREEGQLRFGGLTAIKAERVYRWKLAGDGLVHVLFEDGTDFHHFDPARERPQASHYCDPDEYDVTYDFRRWPDWRAEWRVEGPRKDYRLVSMYSRERRRETA